MTEEIASQLSRSLWSDQYDRQLSDLFAVQDDVAHEVTAALQATLTPAEAKRVAHAPTSNMAAYQLYLRALDLNPILRTQNLSGGELLGQAIRLDSGFAAAYAQLARNQTFRSVAGERAYTDSGFIAARKAVALDPELADGWFALADLQSVVLKLSDARRSYLKALELNPSHGGAMADLANVYVALMPLDDDSATGRFLLAAERQFPTELRIQGLLAWLDLRRGSNRAALERARRMVRNAPDDTEGPPILAELAVVVGDTGAERLIEPLARQDPEAAGQMFPESLRSLYALTLHRRATPGAPRSSGGRPPPRRSGASTPAPRATTPRWSWPRSAPSRAAPMRRSSGSSAGTVPGGRTPGS
jgi:tetratricopeptide (TPR) repeat protein